MCSRSGNTRAELILWRAQNQLLSEKIKQVYFTIHALQNRINQTLQELNTSTLPYFQVCGQGLVSPTFERKRQTTLEIPYFANKNSPVNTGTILHPFFLTVLGCENFSDKNLTEPENHFSTTVSHSGPREYINT